MILCCETDHDVKFIKQSLKTRVAKRVSLIKKGVARGESFFQKRYFSILLNSTSSLLELSVFSLVFLPGVWNSIPTVFLVCASAASAVVSPKELNPWGSERE